MAKAKNTVERVKHPLELDEDIVMHEKGWVVQRIGWALMMLTILAGALGLFGEGVISKQQPKLGELRAEYDKFFRYETEMKIVIESPASDISTISLPQAYLKKFRMVRFVPDPLDNITNSEDVVFNFQGTQNHIVTIYMVPKSYGTINANMRVNSLDPIQLSHFIYP